MEPSGFSSPRSECFPAGLRVLVVDDDPTWLKILEKMLKKCNYEVTTCNLARDALDLLRGRKDGYDIVISDVNMPDMDGFKLLEHVGLEMDLPVIMMSVDGETSRVMKGVQHGACDYLLKPIRMKELKNIWQHVLRKRIHEVRDTEGHDNFDEIQLMRGGPEQPEDGYLFCGDNFSGRKRKDTDNSRQHEDRMCGDPTTSSVKKARVVWTVELHQKFVKAVNQIGFEKVGPKKILDLMGVPWLTRENVASHLQKYRLYYIRLQKENESKATFGSAKKDVSITVCHQNTMVQNTTAMPPNNIFANETYSVSGNNILTRNDETTIKEGNPKAKGMLSVSKMEPRRAGSNISFNYHSFGPLRSNVKSESTASSQFPWANEVQAQSFQFKQDKKPHFQTEPKFDYITNIPMHHRTVNPLQHSLPHNPGPLRGDFDKPAQAYGKNKVDPVRLSLPHNPGPSNGVFEKTTQAYCRKTHDPGELAKDENAPALFTVQPESHSRSFHAIDPIPCSSWDTRSHGLDKGLFGYLETIPRNTILGWDEKFNDYSKEFQPPDDLFGNLELFGYVNHGTMADFPPHLYDPLKFDSEYVSDLVEYPVIDQGLFIA